MRLINRILEILYGSFVLVETLGVGLDLKMKTNPELPETVSARAKSASILDRISLCGQSYSVQYCILRGNMNVWVVDSELQRRGWCARQCVGHEGIVIRTNALLVDVFLETGDRINSPIREFFDFLRDLSILNTLWRMSTTHWRTSVLCPPLKRWGTPTTRKGKADAVWTTRLTATNSRRKRDSRAVEKEEEEDFGEGIEEVRSPMDENRASEAKGLWRVSCKEMMKCRCLRKETQTNAQLC